MFNMVSHVERPKNEATLSYAPASPERGELAARLSEMTAERIDIPLVIGGKKVRTGHTASCVMPHDHGHVLATYHLAGERELQKAIESAQVAKKTWENTSWEHRAAVFWKAAELLAGPWRSTLNSATMLGQSKTVNQAEPDAACELADFWRFNCHFAANLFNEQPLSTVGAWNRTDYRPLEGFILAITPFNFTAIAGNLASAPALMGNTVIWKPAATAIYSGYYLMQLYQAAGLPDGVINFVPAPRQLVSEQVMTCPQLAGVHFTGSTSTFRNLWMTAANNLASYKSFPRLVGETSGKGFVFAHPSADVSALVSALVEGAFGYQGQKCSAASRAYIPTSLWPQVKSTLLAMLA